MPNRRIGVLLVTAAVLATGCASGPVSPPPDPAPAPEIVVEPPKPADRPRMPEYQPSGMKEEWKRCRELEAAVKDSKKLDEQEAAKKALADHLAGFPSRWEGKDVPAPEACYYAVMLQKCRLYREAAREAGRYIEVAPEDSANYLNAHTCLISSLAQAGDFDGAEAELARVRDTVYRGRDAELLVVQETVANVMLRAGRVDRAAEYFRARAEGFMDIEAAVAVTDCYLRMGRTDDALDLARRMAGKVTEEKSSARARVLVEQLSLVGKPAPGFAGVKWWKGVGGPVADADLKGKVTVVFAWNMKSAWNQFFFDRLAAMIRSLEGRPVQVIGISRLAKYDPVRGTGDLELTDEQELAFYDMWAQQYPVTYPLAVGEYGSEALIGPWAARYVPYYVVVDRDGIVTYVRTGKNEEHFAALREMVERALER